jgi:putative FmdB family regulatory protein
MPLYEYECDACGHRFEVIQKFSDPLVDTCPKCGAAVRKLMSSPAFHLKGTGWYATDYAKKDSGVPTKTDGGSKSGDSKEKSESKNEGDTKPSTTETKSESKSEKSKSGTKTESKAEAKSDSKTAKKTD